MTLKWILSIYFAVTSASVPLASSYCMQGVGLGECACFCCVDIWNKKIPKFFLNDFTWE